MLDGSPVPIVSMCAFCIYVLNVFNNAVQLSRILSFGDLFSRKVCFF
ncbi:hypothetical protein CSB93_5280 [Pseudomonas paraeruginosa]|uniref:Uncharacterized protein n=1 Tax=Pseudomonas paraeruginosa TaxID=2994495 RepID=A0A2R3IUC2_9PSED|nr:hypothetical protein CSB93_5280 [Pseudomonas paraeruginosa]AWE90633.1 hypothetical protein CSC28_4072 [Pseudomonas paraeruginosa]PTC35207.1 hypothetical protein CLJ1_3907 [Pseudomonas aeruginosa]